MPAEQRGKPVQGESQKVADLSPRPPAGASDRLGLDHSGGQGYDQEPNCNEASLERNDDSETSFEGHILSQERPRGRPPWPEGVALPETELAFSSQGATSVDRKGILRPFSTRSSGKREPTDTKHPKPACLLCDSRSSERRFASQTWISHKTGVSFSKSRWLKKQRMRRGSGSGRSEEGIYTGSGWPGPESPFRRR
jgi:ribosomal protein L37AE/L43A